MTGASSGLGRRFALDLARAGAIVTAIARAVYLLHTLEEEMRRYSADSKTVVCDVSDIAAFTKALAAVESANARIDLLINNAGIGEPQGEEDGLAAYRKVMETNDLAPVAGTLAVLPGMRRRGRGWW